MCQKCNKGTVWNGIACVIGTSGINGASNIISTTSTTTVTTTTGNTTVLNPTPVTCQPNASFNGTTCVCNIGYINYQKTCYACPTLSIAYDGTKCVCSNGYVLSTDGQSCIQCPISFISSNNVCVCPPNTFNVSGVCATCPNGMTYANGGCQCNTGTYNINGTCQACPINTQYNGTGCACITGTFYINGYCVGCPINSYYNGTYCTCSNGYTLNSNQTGCVAVATTTTTVITGPGVTGTNTSTGSSSSTTTVTTSTSIGGSTTGGSSSTTSTPVCPKNSVWNGKICECITNYYLSNGVCLLCPANSVWNGLSCACPQGTNLYMGNCVTCPTNGGWDGTKCSCASGFFFVGGNCVKCGTNTFYDGTNCVCNRGYYQTSSGCALCDPSCGTCEGPAYNQCQTCTDVTYTLSNGTCSKGICDPATYLDITSNSCKKCSPFCSNCTDDKSCTACQSGFNLAAGYCTEICGDGKRFVLACDDGNTINGDGCSSTCTIESGYNCRGGTSTSKDTCVAFAPSKTIISVRGKVHEIGKVTSGYRINYVPSELLKNGCPLCSQLLMIKQISGDSIAVISENFVPQTQYSINVVFDFNGIEPIPDFNVTVQVNPVLASYFPNVDISQIITDDIDPSLLALNQYVETLSLDSNIN
jgi:proprotein convertase subtilisin/kexin type 5